MFLRCVESVEPRASGWNDADEQDSTAETIAWMRVRLRERGVERGRGNRWGQMRTDENKRQMRSGVNVVQGRCMNSSAGAWREQASNFPVKQSSADDNTM